MKHGTKTMYYSILIRQLWFMSHFMFRQTFSSSWNFFIIQNQKEICLKTTEKILSHVRSCFSTKIHQHFLLFPKHFLLYQKKENIILALFNLSSANAFKLVKWKGLKLHHTAEFYPQSMLTLSQTSPGFYVLAVQVFWKHCGKRRNCS